MTTDEKGVFIQIQNTSVSSKTLVLVNCLNAFVHGCTESKAVISPPKRIKKTYTFPQALSYASQHTFLMFRIILSVSVFIHLPIKSQHYIAREQRPVLCAYRYSNSDPPCSNCSNDG